MKGNYLIIKLLIIIAIVIVGGTVLFPQTNDLFFNDFDETKNDLVDFKDEAINNAEVTFDNTVNKITTSIDDTIDQVGNKLSDLNLKLMILYELFITVLVKPLEVHQFLNFLI